MTDRVLTSANNADIAPEATPLVTSGVVQDVDNTVRCYTITTGGSGGEEYLNIPNPTLDDNGFNPSWTGRQISFYLAEQTDPADVVVISIENYGLSVPVYGSYVNGVNKQHANGGVKLGYASAQVVFTFIGGNWTFDNQMTGGNDTTAIVGISGSFTTVDSKTVGVTLGQVTSIA